MQGRVRLPACPVARAHDRRPEHQRASAKTPSMHAVSRRARQWGRFGSSRAPLLGCERRVAALQRCQRRRELAVPLLLHLQSIMRPLDLQVHTLLQPPRTQVSLVLRTIARLCVEPHEPYHADGAHCSMLVTTRARPAHVLQGVQPGACQLLCRIQRRRGRVR